MRRRRWRRAALALLLPLAALTAGARAQEEGGAQEDPRSPLERAREEAAREAPLGGEPVLGPGGEPLVPGALPADSSPEARAAWEEVLRATLAPEPVRAFDLSFYLLQRQESPQVNNVKARIQFLAPRFVRARLQKSGREHVRGPDGDWLVDGDERVRLVGREGKEDVRQIEQVVGISRNFVALTNPAALRLARLELAEAAPALPAPVAPKAGGLRWISVTSPDFKLVRPPEELAGDGGPLLYEALLGVDPKSSRIVLAEIRESGARPEHSRARILLHFEQHEHVDGFFVPRWIFLYEISSSSMPPTWRAEPSSELKLMQDGIHLRPPFTPDDFRV